MSLQDRLSRARALPGLAGHLRRGYLTGRRVVRRLGFDLVYASYDSPIPDLDALPPGFFSTRSPMAGIAFNTGTQMAFVETELADALGEFQPPADVAQAGPHRFYLRNGTYESVDAELLYAIVRRFTPRRIVELGSGYSTLIIREALDAGGRRADDVLRTYDPYPSDLLAPGWPVAHLSAQDVPESAFAELGEGDILFVDTSHTVKAGGDVNRIVLDILPRLASGVIVHFHDIFLPFPYSRGHLEDAHFWTEQYLLQAFLSGNPDWEVLAGGQAIARDHPDRLAAVVPSFGPRVSPGAFWIRRRA